ncbi:MAG: thioredoxin family protein [Planctomycetaceae bacterium]|nr:thioredoxin family protein [Planctomycetaceae bacterium]
MVKTASTMLPLGAPAPDFALPDVVSGKTVQLADFRDRPGLLVIFLCNHCPFVKHLAGPLAELTSKYQGQGLGVVGINSNDIEKYPQDNADAMREEVKLRGYVFPYLLDETQAVAQAYQAACTPDFFLFDAAHRLVYRGQFDSSRPGLEIPITGQDLAAAIEALLQGRSIDDQQFPSLGCNIKWKPGNEPYYFPTPPINR